MKPTLDIIIFSLFTAIFLMDVLNISLKIRSVLKLNLLKKYTILKPLECLTCFSFWIGIITSTVMKETFFTILITGMAVWLCAYLLEIIRNK